MDSTVLYYFGKDGGPVTPAMLADPRLPTTRTCNPGLTPTPICTVSKDSLDAMLHAPQGPWLYFTPSSTRMARLNFSTTFAAAEERVGRQEKRHRMTWRLGVVGSPVAHSLSPQLHEAGLRMAGLSGHLDARRTVVGASGRASRELLFNDFDALSVTSPLKHAAFDLCDE